MALEHFTWETMWQEMAKVTPSLLSLLQACTPTQAASERVKTVVCLCTAILAKFQNSKLSLVQAVISLIMQTGHASEQVSNLMTTIALTIIIMIYYFPVKMTLLQYVTILL